ncbi:unnamed protein product, partial [Discosporangium mesarthrocarpum]
MLEQCRLGRSRRDIRQKTSCSPSVISCGRRSEKHKVPLMSLSLALAHQAWKERVQHTRTSLHLERQGRRTRPHLQLNGQALHRLSHVLEGGREHR